MTTTVAPAFTDSDTGLFFSGGILFRENGNCFLHGSHGHCILLDDTFANQLLREQIPSALKKPLSSRGFCGSTSPCGKAFQEPRPDFFMVDLTNQCNMRCKYCLRDVNGSGRSVDERVLREICRYIQDYCDREHLRNVSIQPWGGEPLLRLDAILKMKEWIRPTETKTHFSVETNGVLLNQETIDLLYDNRIGVGISIDGTESCHDAQRVFANGGKTHSLVFHNLLCAKEKYGQRLGTITTITQLNIQHAEDILEFLAVDAGLSNVKFNFVHQSRFSCCDSLCLTPEEISSATVRIFRKLAELTERGFPITERNVITKLKNLLFNEYSDICLSRGCHGGVKMIVFDMDGGIFPCELTDFPEERIGNVFQGQRDLIGTVRQAMQEKRYFQRKEAEKCAACPWHCYCMGGCSVRIMTAKNPASDVDEIECATNCALYPEMIRWILTRPETVNAMLGYEAVVL